MGKRRGKRGGGRIRGIAKKVAKLWEAAIVERPVKHILFSDAGVTGGAAGGFSSTELVLTKPAIMLLNPISRPAGATNVQMRLADYAYITSLRLKLRTQYGTAITGRVVVRWMLFIQREPKGVALTANQFGTDYFGKVNPVSNAIPNTNNEDVKGRYRVLRRGMIVENETIATAVETRVWNIRWAAKKAIRVSYVLGNAGTIADIDTNALYLYMWTDNANGVGGTGILTTIEGNVYFRDQV